MSNVVEELDLIVRIRGTNLDGSLASTLRYMADTGSRGNTLGIVRAADIPAMNIVAIKRADGQPIGHAAEFESYWEDTHCTGAGEWTEAKSAAWGAWQAAIVVYGASE